jgi:hypothetical protein
MVFQIRRLDCNFVAIPTTAATDDHSNDDPNEHNHSDSHSDDKGDRATAPAGPLIDVRAILSACLVIKILDFFPFGLPHRIQVIVKLTFLISVTTGSHQ